MSISKAEFLRTLQRYKAAQDNALSGVTMPVAGASTLGGVKIGAGLSMVGDTLTVVWDNFSLGSTPSTVEGAMWVEGGTSSTQLALRHNNKIYHVPLIPPPEITSVTVTPSTLSVMQGASATATITAEANEYVTGLSYALSGAPNWMTLADNVITCSPASSDSVGTTTVTVIASDTGSTTQNSTAFSTEIVQAPEIYTLSLNGTHYGNIAEGDTITLACGVSNFYITATCTKSNITNNITYTATTPSNADRVNVTDNTIRIFAADIDDTQPLTITATDETGLATKSITIYLESWAYVRLEVHETDADEGILTRNGSSTPNRRVINGLYAALSAVHIDFLDPHGRVPCLVMVRLSAGMAISLRDTSIDITPDETDDALSSRNTDLTNPDDFEALVEIHLMTPENRDYYQQYRDRTTGEVQYGSTPTDATAVIYLSKFNRSIARNIRLDLTGNYSQRVLYYEF